MVTSSLVLANRAGAAGEYDPASTAWNGLSELAAVAAGARGDGRFVALSDPSVLINDMLAFDGNLAFAAKLLDFLAPVRPGRIILITGDTALTGEPKSRADDTTPVTFDEAMAQVG